MKIPVRMGIGYDVHKLVPNRPLILGGVTIAHDLGLLGHSDADVLTHAIMDALLGALALGDIGKWFPDTEEAYKGASSIGLLEKVRKLIDEQGYSIGNIDSIIVAQAPRCAPHIEAMRTQLSQAMGITLSQISVKATTEEKLGFTGRQEGIAAKASAVLYLKEN